MAKTITRKRQYYTLFRKLPKGARFRIRDGNTGPFTKFNQTNYESSSSGKDILASSGNLKVRRLWKVGIEAH